MILIYLEELSGPLYKIKVNEYDVKTHDGPPEFGINVKCVYSHDKYEILGEFIKRMRDRNAGSMESNDLRRLRDLMDTAYIEAVFHYRRRKKIKQYHNTGGPGF